MQKLPNENLMKNPQPEYLDKRNLEFREELKLLALT